MLFFVILRDKHRKQMFIKRLSILNYKNIASAALEFSPKINCFIGQNGEGKTNVLDAIYFLSFTKSATNTIDSLNVHHGEEMMMLQGSYWLRDAEEEIMCGMKLHQKKIFQRNRKAYKRMAEHIGLLPLIMVSPNDIDLVHGGSEERRRFMDGVIAQYNKNYISLLSRYNKALQQRNALLKSDDVMPQEMLSVYEEIMSETGEEIYRERDAFIRDFIPVFQKYYTEISGNQESVALAYTSHCQRGALLDVIRSGRNKDFAVGYSLHGVHKDDLEMRLNGFPLKREGSQGQNKTYLISLKLAQFDFLKQTSGGTRPILLLDDIFDKLDALRVEKIVNLVSEDTFGQIFITDTNRENLDRILIRTQGDYRIFMVKHGEISPFINNG